jgi:hypothetical protein
MADLTAQGIQAFGALADQSRKRMAYNALVQSFGPQAADPEAWGQSVSAQKAAAELPYAGQQAAERLKQTQAATASTEATTAETQQSTLLKAQQSQREAQFRALKMLQSSVDPETGGVTKEAFDTNVRANAATLGLDPAHIEPLYQQLSTPGGAKHMDAMEQALIAPSAATGAPQIARDAEGNTVAVRFDKYGNPIQTNLGGLTTTAQQNADTGVARQAEKERQDKLLNQLAAGRLSVAQYTAAVRGANAQYTPDTAGPGGGTSSSPPATAGAQPGESAPAPAYFDRLKPGTKAYDTAISGAQQIGGSKQNLDNATAIMDSMETQIKPYTTGAGSLMKNLPGTLAKNLERNSETLNAQAAQAVLQGMKNTQGQTGLGRILQAEYKNFTAMYGNLAQDQTSTQYSYHLDLLRRSLNRMFDIQREGYQKRYGKEYDEVLPTTAAPPTPENKGGSDIDALVNQYRTKR